MWVEGGEELTDPCLEVHRGADRVGKDRHELSIGDVGGITASRIRKLL